jgi:hypothetical protein
MLPLNLPPQDYLRNKPTPLTQADFFDQTDRLRWLHSMRWVSGELEFALYFAYARFLGFSV